MRISSEEFYTRIGCLGLFILLLGGCADQTVRVSPPVVWGAAGSVVQTDNLFIAGQPDQQALQSARDAGVELVINFRQPDEMDWDEEAATRALGMQYLAMPISKSGPGFDPVTINALHQIVNENPDKKILMHCSSGNRVSAWYAVYLVEQKGYWLEEALPIAEQTGLNKPELVTRLREYLDAQ